MFVERVVNWSHDFVPIHSIPHCGGASDSLAKLRPLLVAGSSPACSLWFVQSWREKKSGIPTSRLSAAMLWILAVVVFSMIAFSQ